MKTHLPSSALFSCPSYLKAMGCTCEGKVALLAKALVELRSAVPQKEFGPLLRRAGATLMPFCLAQTAMQLVSVSPPRGARHIAAQSATRFSWTLFGVQTVRPPPLWDVFTSLSLAPLRPTSSAVLVLVVRVDGAKSLARLASFPQRQTQKLAPTLIAAVTCDG